MLGRTYTDQDCSIARTLELVGERWTLLILRDTMNGIRRFGDLAEHLGVARNVLRDRLARLVDEGVLERVPYQERPLRHEYRLTAKGRDLWLVMIALMHFGDRYFAPDGPPVVLRHRGCGGAVDERGTCASCGDRLVYGQVYREPGPGARAA